MDKILLIGGSAGSIKPLIEYLSELDKDDDTCIALVIHRGQKKLNSLTKMLDDTCKKEVREASHRDMLSPDIIYIAPADYHMLVTLEGRLELDYSEKVLFSRPSIDVSALSFARSFKEKLTFLLLSGANKDGAHGAKMIKQKGGKVIVQNPDEAEFSMMPESAIEFCKEEIDAIVNSSNINITIQNLAK